MGGCSTNYEAERMRMERVVTLFNLHSRDLVQETENTKIIFSLQFPS
jgi:hypothetical protein